MRQCHQIARTPTDHPSPDQVETIQQVPTAENIGEQGLRGRAQHHRWNLGSRCRFAPESYVRLGEQSLATSRRHAAALDPNVQRWSHESSV
jgi:hypothetical protein